MAEPESVVVVESPAKAKTINKYLGRNFKVLASYGHVRDLPPKDGSVDPNADFKMIWEVDARAQKRLKDIADAVKSADRLILATDPDREGEAISWHVLEALRQRKALGKTEVKRVVFNAITKSAVLDAMAHPREINEELVDAYLARRALDYLVGFTLSPVLWRKLPGARSAGRVQSVALRLVCERELEIEAFKPQEYWSVEADFGAAAGNFTARLVRLNGQKLDKLSIGEKGAAQKAVDTIKAGRFSIGEIEKKPVKRHPWPPFITSTLQQEASRKLGFSASRTMRIAQDLYEGAEIGGDTVGLITYMRTDGVTMAGEAVTESRRVIGELHGDRYVPKAPRTYASKVKNAQEAHEAIRPTSFARTPEKVARYLESDHARLYELIWKRALASQMESAEQERTSVDVVSADDAASLRATGTVTLFDGFLRLYQESRDDDGDSDDGSLPKLTLNEALRLLEIRDEQHFTEPPPRYSEASLVKKLEELGIGRPSTYASILSVLRDRAYVRLERGRFVPEPKGRIVTAFLSSFFKHYIEYDFTADLEEKLDEVASGELPWKQLLRDFWTNFHTAAEEAKELKFADVVTALDDILGPHMFPKREDGADPRTCPTCGNGRLGLKLGRFGAFIGCSNYPECRFTRQLGRPDENGEAQPRELGVDPKSGEVVSLKSGRFGPYVQLGEQVNGEKPPRAGIPKGFTADTIDLEMALKLLALPREVGTHPETGKPIMAGFGRFGPFLQHDGGYASLESPEEVFTVGINRAVTVLAERKAKGGGPRRGGQALKELGAHPESGAPVKVMKGKYGPYVSDGKLNATLPQGSDPGSITMEEAVSLLAARAAKGPGGKKGGKKAKAESKAAAQPKAKKKAENGEAPNGESKPKPKRKAKPKSASN